MNIASELTALNGYILGAYSAINAKGGTMPANKNMANLATAISGIPSGGASPCTATIRIDSGAPIVKVAYTNQSGTFQSTTISSSATISTIQGAIIFLTAVGAFNLSGSGYTEHNPFSSSNSLFVVCNASTASITVGGSCFVAGTPVLMADGSMKKIEDVVVGDIVESYDTETITASISRVSKTYKHANNVVVELYSDDGLIVRTTPNHPIYADGEFKRAEELTVGAKMVDADGESVVVSEIRTVAEDGMVFNLEVADTHTYFVGEQKVLVHNKPE